LLARELGWEFYDADDFHPQSNIDKMHSGRPLTDHDREPWLARLRDRIETSLATDENAVLGCSALKKKYRDELRVSLDVKFIFLHGTRERIADQLKNRHGHFFDPKLLDSQFGDLEEPESRQDAIMVDLSGEPRDVVNEIKAILRAR
jgi:gluconokinase